MICDGGRLFYFGGILIATTRIIPMHRNKGKTVAKCLHDRTAYALNPDKTRGGDLVSAYQCNPQIVDAEFLFSKRQYYAHTGRSQKNDVIAYQVRQSFKPGEITPEEANRVGYEFAQRFLKGNHAFIVATHVDRAHIHNHIIWNSTTLDCRHKFKDFFRSAMAVRKLSDIICLEHGLSIIEAPKKQSGDSYDKWLGDRKLPSHREQLRFAIDDALAKKPKSFDDLLQLLREAGYEVTPRGKDISIRGKNEKGNIRLSSLKAPYTKDMLIAAIAGNREHTPRKRPEISSTPKASLLVDIDKKLHEGKGVGYAKWASTFNLKQMAATLSFLTENKMLAYSDLKKAADDSSEKFDELADEIKAAEQRMAEIAALRTHILNYIKTRDVYVAYRNAGYSKKFRADHESEILLHQVAKKAFDELGLKKLPTVKSLNAEYAELMARKKKAYAEYRDAREKMCELQIHKANVDMLLGINAKDQERKQQHQKEQEQR